MSAAFLAAIALAGPLEGEVVALDPGHNGGNFKHPDQINRQVDIGTGRKACDTTGTATLRGYRESAFNLDVARRARKLLEARGARVVLTRSDDRGVGPCITRRAAIGNRARAGASVSIHADGGPPGGRGFHVIAPRRIKGLTDDIATPSRRLALELRGAYRAATGMAYSTYAGERALSVRGDLGGLNRSDVPKVFLETGNMRNARDAGLLSSAAFRQRAARGIALGIERYLTGGGAP
jgi:N-acetylmuramoyl-L-alanine amidase